MNGINPQILQMLLRQMKPNRMTVGSPQIPLNLPTPGRQQGGLVFNTPPALQSPYKESFPIDMPLPYKEGIPGQVQEPSVYTSKGGEIEPWQMTQKEFENIPIIKYIEANKKGMKVPERNQLAEQLVDMGLMKIEDFNAMTGQFGFGGEAVGVKNLTTGKSIPSKPIEGKMGDVTNYIGQWQTFTNVPLFAHRDAIVRALVEGKDVPQKVLDEYKGWKFPDKEGAMGTLKEAVESYGGSSKKRTPHYRTD